MITIAVILLLRPFSATLHRSLRAWLAEEETKYVVAIQERLELIKRWGPREDAVDPYPIHEEFYITWDLFIPAFQCPHRVQRLGTLGDGGKWVCGLSQTRQIRNIFLRSVSFSTLLQRAPGSEACGYDYSVSSWGPGITNCPELRGRADLKTYALGGTNNHSDNGNLKFCTLNSLMDLNGHTFIDTLKVDIEGGEFDALATFLTANAERDVLPVGQLQLEIHARGGCENFVYVALGRASLEAAGLRPFWTEPNWPGLSQYSFINICGYHALVNDALD
ncbi:hypothetical protein V8E53_003920 [Lactarius tabidus]